MSKDAGLYTTPKDNTKIVSPTIVLKVKLSPELIKKIEISNLQRLSNKNQSRIYDADRARYYRNLQNFYNNNAFGYGLLGRYTRFDPTTPEGLSAIQSNFDYARSNATDFILNITGAGVSSVLSKASGKAGLIYSKLFKSPFRLKSLNGSLGAMKLYVGNGIIGNGAEAVVIKNTPTTVGKITTIPVQEMAVRNSIPNTVLSKYIGFVKNRGAKLPTYVLNKVKVLTEETFPKYVTKLDKAMLRSGFRKVNDPNVLYRAYTNGTIIIDDIAPGNVGLTSGNSYLDLILPNYYKNPKIIDMSYLTVPEWLALGFTFKRGGKLILKCQWGKRIDWLPEPTRWSPTNLDDEPYLTAPKKNKSFPYVYRIPTNEEVVDSYIKNVLYTMENPTNKGFNRSTGKYGVYTDKDSDGNILYNIGPGINKNSDIGSKLSYSDESEYSKQYLNSLLRPELLKQLKEINKDLLHFTDYPDTISPGNKMILLDIAHNVRPRDSRKNMPLLWPNLVNSIIQGNPDVNEMYSKSTRRRDMRGQLSNKWIIDKNTIKNK